MNVEIGAIVTNPESTTSQLRVYINRTHEINRLIAAHPNADAIILDKLLDFRGEDDRGTDLEVRHLVARHPHVNLDTLMNLGEEFHSDLLRNPALWLFLAEEQNLFELVPEVLSTPGCPVKLMESIVNSGTICQKAMLLLNPELPSEFRGRLSPEALSDNAAQLLDSFIEFHKDGKIDVYLAAYKGTARSYCVPRFVEMDSKNPGHRRQDQVLTGFPYTSKKWPWPVGSTGRPMQPIAQIDIENAGRLLGASLGAGLLQVWGGVGDYTSIHRLITVDDLNDELSDFYPSKPAWLAKDDRGNPEMNDCMISYFSLWRYLPFDFERCRIEWIPLGKMYSPCLTDPPLSPLSTEIELPELDDETYRHLDRLNEELYKLEVPTGLRPGIRLLFRLGGYMDGLGNTRFAYEDQILLYHSIDTGVKTTVGVTYRRSPDGDVEFFTGYTCDM